MDLSPEHLRRWLSAHRRERIDRASLVAFCITLFWLAGNLISPFLVPSNTIDFGEDGKVGVADNMEKADIGNAFARFFYAAGDANCHQHADRSFFLNGNQMPFCARCTAIFLGLVLGVALMMFFRFELNIIWIILGLVPMAIDGGVQLMSDAYESTNLLRIITGGLAGFVTGIALGYIVSELGGLVMYKRSLRKGPG